MRDQTSLYRPLPVWAEDGARVVKRVRDRDMPARSIVFLRVVSLWVPRQRLAWRGARVPHESGGYWRVHRGGAASHSR